MRPLFLMGAVLTTAVLASCAAKAQVPTDVELPVLSPPPPPPRVVAAYPEEPEPEPPVVDEPAALARPPSRATRSETPRPETPRVEPARPVTPPSLTLTPAPGVEAQTEAAVRALLSRATHDLAQVAPGALSSDQRAQFDTARRFLQQAEEALKVRNLVYAGKLADKAATLAAIFVR